MKPFTTIAVIFFSLTALLHLARLILGWEVTVNGLSIPVWASGLASVITAALALLLWRERH